MNKIILFIPLALAVGCSKLPGKADHDAPAPATTQAPAKQPVVAVQKGDPKKDDPVVEKKPLGPVFAHKVYNDYLDNQAEAKKTYSGQDVLLVGHVWDVDRNASGKVVMYFSVIDYTTSKSDNRGVQVTFTPPLAFGELERGDRVLVQGRCNGKALGSVNFGNGKFVRKVDANEFK